MASKWVLSFLRGGLSSPPVNDLHKQPQIQVHKRKRVDSTNEPLVADTIAVVPTTYPDTSQPLQETSHNKRRRVLDHVLVEKIDALEFSPLDKGAIPIAAPIINPKSIARASHPTCTSARPRRILKRSSFVPIFDENEFSADEFALARVSKPRKAPRRNKSARAASPIDDEFMPTASSDDPDIDDGMATESTEGQASASDDSASDIRTTAKARSRPNINATSKGSGIGRKPTSKNMHKLKGRITKGLDATLPPLSDISEIFEDIGVRALGLGFKDICKILEDRPLRVGTMCSGTEAPMIGLQRLSETLKSHSIALKIEHCFSSEIVPYKQAYIERNFNPPVIYRDITEMIAGAGDETFMATTVYGRKVPVITDIDILIAGTSCVDYSNLNNKKKGINDGGESGDTFNAVLEYCRRARPSIVILENVKNADWDQMLDRFEAAEYLSTGLHMDTKDFYLPQTRHRGYMVCLDKHKLDVEGSKHDVVRSQIVELISKLQRPASSPFTSFLETQTTTHLPEQNNTDTVKASDWSKCKIYHIKERSEKRIGKSRPFTNWTEDGSTLAPDYGDRQWLISSVERIKDFVDIAFLRKLVGTSMVPYDMKYKPRCLNTTPNVHMETDPTPFGIVPCITPTGEYFMPHLNRTLTPIEKLKLTGIDASRLSLSLETGKQLSDMAGNAMSSTVITSVMISALMAGRSLLRDDGQNTSKVQKEADVDMLLDSPLSQHKLVLSRELPSIDLTELYKVAELTKRQCSCEGHAGLRKTDVRRCRKCGHTACIICSGNPVHDYAPTVASHKHRLDPAIFMDHLRSYFPLRIHPPRSQQLNRLAREGDGADLKLYAEYVAQIEEVLQENFGLHSPRRGPAWTIVYRSETSGSRLEMRIGGANIDLALYVEPPKDMACDHPLRDMLREAVARATATSFSDLEWRWRSPFRTTVSILIEAGDEVVPTIWARHQLEYQKHKSQPRTLRIKGAPSELACDIQGEYELLPACGTSFESLYKRIGGVDDADRPLYLFHDPSLSDPQEQDRFVFATNCERIDTLNEEVRHVHAWMDSSWTPWTTSGNANVSAYEWTTLPQAFPMQQVPMVVKTSRYSSQADVKSGCNHLTGALTLEAETECGSDKQLLSSYRWLAEVVKKQLHMNQWSEHFEVHSSICHTCAPPKPVHKWQARSGAIERYEDPQSAADYEKAAKLRPPPLRVQLTPGTTNATPTTIVDVGLNLTTLAHRARAQLPDDLDDIIYQWRYTRGAASTTNVTRKVFTLQPITGTAPYDGDLKMSIDDFPHQQLSLAWMLSQERGTTCTIGSSSDATSPYLDLAVEMRASGTVEVRGGILADPPGYGKTILSLALIRAEELEYSASEILDQIQPRRLVKALGLIPTAATLVIVPPTIVSQWASEIRDKLGYEDGIVAISQVAQLLKLKMEDFRDAKVIVVARTILTSKVYIDRLAAFAGLPGPIGETGRIFQDWRTVAEKNIAKHSDLVQKLGIKGVISEIKQTYEAAMNSDTFNEYIPSRRLRGKGYVAGKREKKQTAKVAVTDIDTSKVGMPLFEMFYWNRIIVDEFHELTDQSFAAICSLNADKRWGLSGTPAIGDGYEVSRMARLLGVRLIEGSMRPGIMKMKNKRALIQHMTPFEQFDVACQTQSDAAQERVQELLQGFLDGFVRQNSGFDIPYEDYLVPVKLGLAHQIKYRELLGRLVTQDMVVKKVGTKRRKMLDMPERDQHYYGAVDDISYAEEALSQCAAYYNDGDLAILIQRRKQEVKSMQTRLMSSIQAARFEEAERFEKCKNDWLTGDGIGDQDVVAMIQDICDMPNTYTKPVADHETEEIAHGKAYYCSKAVEGADQLLMSQRSLRAAENVQAVQSAKSAKVAAKACCCTDCNLSKSTDVAVLICCGHVVCSTCYGKQVEKGSDHCPAEGCSANMEGCHLFWKSKMVDPAEGSAAAYGFKLAATIDLLTKIHDKGDQAIIFVQFENQLDELQRSLAASDILWTKTTSEFQHNDKRDQKIVLILNASGDGAAGLNLQNANHVIFLSPLLRDQQQVYDATMAQAIGRVRRYGQKKKVHVHRLVALDTVDVDILELRERRTTALKEQDGPEVVEPVGKTKDVLSIDADDTAGNTLVSGRAQNRMQLVQDENEFFSLRPAAWLTCAGSKEDQERISASVPGLVRRGLERVQGWGDFGSLEKWSKVYVEEDE